MQIKIAKNNFNNRLAAKSYTLSGDGSGGGGAKDTFAKAVTTAAFTTGGALGGATLGSVGGHVLGAATGLPQLTTIGLAAGTVAGAGSGVVASLSKDRKATLKRTAVAYGLGTAGAAAGLYGLGALHSTLVGAGAASVLGANTAIVGAVAGGLMGTGLAASGGTGSLATTAKKAGAAALMTSVGVGLGMATSIVAPGTVAPYVFGAAGAVIGNSFVPSEKFQQGEERLATTAASGALGFAVGEGVSWAAQHLGGSALYGLAAPALVGATAALAVNASSNKVAGHLAKATAGAGLGALAGDLVGHGLTSLTGNTLYSAFGAAAGGVAGLAAGTPWRGKALPVLGTGLAGTGAGAMAGVLLASLTGYEAANTIAPVLGAAAGVLTGAAISLNKS